jgi:ubiquinone/menaquinone biosynthesis C-methylase UbiE
MLRWFLEEMQMNSSDSILDIGVSDEDHPASNLLEKNYPYTENLTALGIDNLHHLEKIYSGLTYIKGDGRSLPFDDRSFDFVYSHAVLEHVGSRHSQLTFIAEAFRVARKGVFLTTPNRMHPMEFHTGLPLLHYLPHSWYRALYRLLGKTFYAREENLNLLTEKELLELGYKVAEKQGEIKVEHTKFLFFNANLMLFIKK